MWGKREKFSSLCRTDGATYVPSFLSFRLPVYVSVFLSIFSHRVGGSMLSGRPILQYRRCLAQRCDYSIIYRLYLITSQFYRTVICVTYNSAKHATLGSRVAIVVTLALFIVLARSVYVHAPSLSYRYILDSTAPPLAWLSCGALATPHVDIHTKVRLTRLKT